MKKKSIALAIYSDPKIYPPTINAANILCEKGWTVYLIGVSNPTAPENIFIDPSINFKYIGRHTKGVMNMIGYIRFCFFIWWLTIQKKISVIIAYDAFALLPVYFTAFTTGKYWCYQQHDYFEFPRSFFQKVILHCEKKYSKEKVKELEKAAWVCQTYSRN